MTGDRFPVLESVLTCPACGAGHRETMPTDVCICIYECAACGGVLRRKPGDCCVFCSYGSHPCPPVQRERTSQPNRERRPR